MHSISQYIFIQHLPSSLWWEFVHSCEQGRLQQEETWSSWGCLRRQTFQNTLLVGVLSCHTTQTVCKLSHLAFSLVFSPFKHKFCFLFLFLFTAFSISYFTMSFHFNFIKPFHPAAQSLFIIAHPPLPLLPSSAVRESTLHHLSGLQTRCQREIL